FPNRGSSQHPSWCPVSRKETSMKKVSVLGCAFVFLVGVGGCGSSADSLVKDQIKNMNNMADALEQCDQAKFKELEKNGKDIEKKGKDLDKKLEELKLSDEEKKKLLEKHKDELGAALGRIMQATMKKGLGGGMDKGLEDAMKKGIEDAIKKGPGK